jgi:hypothetical protein
MTSPKPSPQPVYRWDGRKWSTRKPRKNGSPSPMPLVPLTATDGMPCGEPLVTHCEYSVGTSSPSDRVNVSLMGQSLRTQPNPRSQTHEGIELRRELLSKGDWRYIYTESEIKMEAYK